MDNSALFNIGYGLYVLTASQNGKDNGCIINTLMQVSSNPLTCVIGVNKQNLTHDMIKESGCFNISMLTKQAPFEIFKHFGFQSGKTTNKFIDFSNAARADNGIMYIPEFTNAYLSGNVVDSMDFGTHTLFKAEIIDAVKLGTEESITYNYYQANTKPKPEPVKSKGYRCAICGYVYEGDELPSDFICPICKHGAADFVKIEGDK